eukprot:15341566-Ditylum_brightwellii.AAC.1
MAPSVPTGDIVQSTCTSSCISMNLIVQYYELESQCGSLNSKGCPDGKAIGSEFGFEKPFYKLEKIWNAEPILCIPTSNNLA